MKSADEIKRLFKGAAVQTNAAPDDAVFETLKTAYTRTIEHKSAQRELSMWRFVMKNPSVKLAIAAVIVIACLVGLSFWRTTGSGIALADVLARMEQVQVYRLKMDTSFQGEGGQGMPMSQAAMLVSQSLGQKVVMQVNHPLTGQSMVEEIYISPRERAVTTLMPNEKKYSRIELDEASLARLQQESGSPQQIVARVLKSEHVDLGRSVVDGIEVEGFQTTDPNCLGETALTGAEVKIWVGVETRLPVRIEVDKGVAGRGHLHVAAYDFEWVVPVDEAEFTPVIPADYTPGRPLIQIGPKK